MTQSDDQNRNADERNRLEQSSAKRKSRYPFASLLDRTITGPHAIVLASLSLVVSILGMYFFSPDMYVMDSTVAQLRSNIQLRNVLNKAIAEQLKQLPPKVGDLHAAVTRVWPVSDDLRTTGHNGCLVSPHGAVLTLASAVGSTGTSCHVYSISSDFKDGGVNTYTVRWKDASRELAILIPDTPLTCTIQHIEMLTTTAPPLRGDSVAVASSLPVNWVHGETTTPARLSVGCFHLEFRAYVAAYAGEGFELLDRGTNPERFGSPVIDGDGHLVGLVFANHQGGEFIGEPTSLVTLTGPRTRQLVRDLETSFSLSVR